MSGIGGRKRGLEKRPQIVERGGEEFFLGRSEIAAGLGDEHVEAIDDGSGGAEVDLFFAGVGIRNLAEEKPRVLGLENDELIEPGIGCGRCGHGARIGIPGGLYKR
jgi:hypothetical protein